MDVNKLNDKQRIYYYSKLETKLKDPDTYAVILWVFGSLGGHRFYLGQSFHGVIHCLVGFIGWAIIISSLFHNNANALLYIIGVLLLLIDFCLWFKDIIYQKKDIENYNEMLEKSLIEESLKIT